MQYRPLAVLAVCAVALSVPGCGLFRKAQTGPRYGVNGDNEFAVATIPVLISDDRPKWERVYYPGATLPAQHHRAVTFIPMENLQPSAGDLLKRRIAADLNRLADPPTQVNLEIRSFRVVFNDTRRYREWHRENKRVERKEKEADEKRDKEAKAERARAQAQMENSMAFMNQGIQEPGYWSHHARRKRGQSKDSYEAEWKVEQRRRKKEKDKEPGFVQEAVGGLLSEVVQTGTDAAVTEVVRMTDKDFQWGRVPEDLRKDYPDGLTCDIKAVVRLTWSDGRTFVTTVRDQAFGPPPSSGKEAGNVPPVVKSAVKKLSRKMTTQAAQWLSDHKPPSPSS